MSLLRSFFSIQPDLQRTVCSLIRPLGGGICNSIIHHTQLAMVNSTMTIIKTSSELAFHAMLLTGLGREDLEEMRHDIKSSPFPKLRSRWLLIIFHANLHLELHLLVEWKESSVSRNSFWLRRMTDLCSEQEYELCCLGTPLNPCLLCFSHY